MLKSSAEKVILLGIRLKKDAVSDYLSSFEELKLLVNTLGAEVIQYYLQVRDKPDPAYFIGKGKLAEVKAFLDQRSADLLVVNEEISPSQQKNLEEVLKIRVIDRVGLILAIFAKRAQTQEAKLQVELAQYEYLLPRLTKMWQHFSKQIGYIGTRGPGETQLEIDRRRITTKIAFLKQKINQVQKHHNLQRQGRQKRGVKLVALVGYTNAGKSTLLNVLTGENVLVENALFATLDPTVRKLYLPGKTPAVLSDTVGFIQRLPHLLIESFKATLAEVSHADLILHIIDASADNMLQQIDSVFQVLEEIHAIEKPMLLVFNKSDQMIKSKQKTAILLSNKLSLPHVFISALQKNNLSKLLLKIEILLNN